ncbi:SIR2 family protein [Xanthomonas sontii]|uniref:SIR2 family protein n=1 Tax=Xanthomonas sontii TaxID=2650745 RepID=A0A6N7QEN5_9XANT|nr:SIR2 family protein [Xanthomonas sontii]MRH00685.1 SIR2 family protein [Xanthomonas sontii]MRH75017.1 SIR2 family protein [Xanthomonas sontii]
MNKAALNRFLSEYPDALNDGVGAIFVGAGVSMAAGYPSWSELLSDIAAELEVDSKNVHDLAALAQWSILENGGSTRVRSVIKNEIGPDKPIPETVQIISRLPVRHIWTTNYDRLLERAFESISRPLNSISGPKDLALRTTAGATLLYKMHGSVDRLDEVVISTDDYELYRSRRGQYLPLFQAHLTSMSMLFIGISFTDPNIRHVLSLIRESFTDAPPEHFAIVRAPQRADFTTEGEFAARNAQHKLWAKDLKRYGLLAVEVSDYAEIPPLLRQIEKRVAARRIWVSGSWPLEQGGSESANIHALAENIGRKIGETGRYLVSGAGLLVGSASLSGFLAALRLGGGWDLERRLIARPFPQPLAGAQPNEAEWAALRVELARQAGIAVFIGGAKLIDGALEVAHGVEQEFRVAKDAGVFLLPVGSTGAAAKKISDYLLGSGLASSGQNAQRPTDDELNALSDRSLLANKEGRHNLVSLVFKIVDRITFSA